MAVASRRRSSSPRVVIRERSWLTRCCARGACVAIPWTRQWPVSAGLGIVAGSCLRPTMSR
eukprot:3695673-Alexandrium_andersonii.AAC.1